MLELTPTPALESGSFQIDGFSLSENSDVALASIAARLGQEQACAAAALSFLGTDLPGIQQVVRSNGYKVFWTGPDQYFVEAPFASHEDIEARLKAALKETASVTEQTGGWVRFDARGEKIVATFERLCMVDLAATPADRAVRTVIEHIGCFVVTRADGVSVWTPRSYAGSMFHAITVAARSV